MNPVEFKEQNDVLKAPPNMEGCGELPICRVADSKDNPIVISCWDLSEEEIQEIVKTGKLYLWVWGRTQPPVGFTTAPPEVQI